jgi:FMN phosphatase YigB (HAD superfamily)
MNSTYPFVVFDADDTLWDVEVLYETARISIRRELAQLGLDDSRWEELERAIDVRNFDRMGFSTDRFPTSCVDAYTQLAIATGVNSSSSVRDEIWHTASSVFKAVAPVFQGAWFALEQLRPKFELTLLTQGNKDVQSKRIADSGLESFFSRIEITERKNEESFLKVSRAISRPAVAGWSVGNSVASDIDPALAVGMRAVWIPANSWEFERRKPIAEHGDYEVLDELSALPALLEKLD